MTTSLLGVRTLTEQKLSKTIYSRSKEMTNITSKKNLRNPILPGFYPDPSICRVGDDFYMITSSFELFPGVPIFHSTDLSNWEQIGNVLDRKSQLHLTADNLTGGIMAPTIRYNKGVFYVITTNVDDRWNFLVTATDPRGPWSEPHWLNDVEGIDPSLFFDEDGRVYFTGTRTDRNEDGSVVERAIWLSEIDLENMRLIGPKPTIWRGALRNAASPEAPHLYKKDGYYYLVIAEGGTEHFHAVTIARSKNLFDFFEGHAGNPIMTHRHLGKMYPICNTGHADLVELESGEWYAVMLASRLFEGYHKNLGRETFIAPVIWENGWPVISPGTGKIEASYPMPNLPEFKPKTVQGCDEFDSEKLGDHWVFIGTPDNSFHEIKESKLILKLQPRPMCTELKPFGIGNKKDADGNESGIKNNCLGFIGRRQLHINFSVSAKMNFTATKDNDTAGIVVLQASNHQFRLERSMEAGKQIIRLIQSTCEMKGMPWLPGFKSKTTELVLAKNEVNEEDIYLKITERGQELCFYYGPSEKGYNLLHKGDGAVINPEAVGGMVGTMLGMFASSNGEESENCAAFDWFDYRGEE